MSDAASAPAGWHPQPDGRLRYWDGQAWTDHYQDPAFPAPRQVPPPKKSNRWIMWTLIGAGALVILFIVIGVAATSGSTQSTKIAAATPSARTSSPRASTPASTPTPSSAATTAAPSPAGPKLTPQQQNAVRAAKNYLGFHGFSRQGLIDQLSSPHGDKYAVEDATAAVDSLTVDWNEQAAKAAKAYVSMTGFSCQGLIDQLASDYGDKFTVEQATYGAKQTSACG